MRLEDNTSSLFFAVICHSLVIVVAIGYSVIVFIKLLIHWVLRCKNAR